MTGVIETFPLLTNYQTDTESPRPPCWMLRLDVPTRAKDPQPSTVFQKAMTKTKKAKGKRIRLMRSTKITWLLNSCNEIGWIGWSGWLDVLGGQGDWWRQLCSFTWSLFQLLSACRQENRSSNLEKKCCFFKIEEKQGVGRQGGRESFFKKLPIKQSMTYQDREFFIFLVVSEKIGTRKKSRNRNGKIWYRKKSRNR